MALTYSDKVKERFLNPAHQGEIKNPSAKARVQSEVCGDEMEMYITVKDGIIKECKFQTFGCAASVATSDMLCELAEGKTVEQAEEISREQVIEGLGDLPKVKLHCSDLAAKSLKRVLERYKNGKKES